MRYVFRIGFALALGLALMAGCSDENGEGGSGGSAGTGGTGGNGGSNLCEGVECTDDGNVCTEDVCNPANGTCGVPVESGTACSGGACLDGACTSLVRVQSYVTVLGPGGVELSGAGATVSVLGTSLSTIADESGEFAFNVFEGEWFFATSKEGTWGHITYESVRSVGAPNLQPELFSDELVAQLADRLGVGVDEEKGEVQVGFFPASGEGGETATLSEPYDYAVTDDAEQNFVFSDELLPGGGWDLSFLGVAPTDELVVTPKGVEGVNVCVLQEPQLLYPVKAKFRTQLSADCSAEP